MSRSKIIVISVLVLIAIVSAIKIATLQGGGVSMLHSKVQAMRELYANRPAFLLTIYCSFFVISTALSIPLGNILAVFGGAIFGVKTALIAACLSSAGGATGAFFIARYLLREHISEKYGIKIDPILKTLEKKGFAYVVAIRFAFFFPYSIVNWALGISRMHPIPFFIATAVGQAPIKYIFAKAGTSILNIQSISDVLTPQVIIIFVVFSGTGLLYATISQKKLMKKIKVDNQTHIHG